ncbi:uncharacterized protein F4822DRAFT_429069 [Hypoxylon trugodes]|uniref:uncharacterized protein n=1 Tax=Hypoxylon trugodes TaxID=326681 RepID=UPI00219B9450|nr:uncharacterized protein F4822DRAFT_429069 [Hypoxylon trugodes]KAI1388445.1 hypothetical protein F4822DRAFT_429069 [Hypoxylon trugodes]
MEIATKSSARENQANRRDEGPNKDLLLLAGLPSPVVRFMVKKFLASKPLFNDQEGKSIWVWGDNSPYVPTDSFTGFHDFLVEDNPRTKRKGSAHNEDAGHSRVAEAITLSSYQAVPHKKIVKSREKVQDWLSNGSISHQDHNISPLSNWTSLGESATSAQSQLFQGSTPPSTVDAPVDKQNFSVIVDEPHKTTPFQPEKHFPTPLSRLPLTQKEIKRIRFNKSTKMDSTPQRDRVGMAGSVTGTPSRDPFHHSRSTSRSHLEKRDDVSHFFYHARNGSISSSKVPSPERGRSMQRRYEFPTSGSDNLLSPVYEGAGNRDPAHITTMTDIIGQGNVTPSRGSRSMSRHKSPPKPALASSAKKEKRRPQPLDLKEARRYGAAVTTQANIQPIHNPLTPEDMERSRFLGDSPTSVYTDDTPFRYDEPAVGPVHALSKPPIGSINILQGYQDWKMNSPVGEHMDINGNPCSKGMAENDNASQAPIPAGVINRDIEAPPFTPLTPWIGDGKTRRAKKTLISDKGWLEDTAAEAKKPEAKKNTKFFDGVKKTARRLAEMTEVRNAQPRIHTAQELSISLDPREQSLLYCELEFILSNALSGYINVQLHSGRLNPHVLAKIADAWEQKGRPKVIGFRYDVETQVDMIAAHIGTFRFYGPFQTDPNFIKGLLYGMKMDARVMRIRTYCHPDSVVAKHILDAQAVLQLLDSPERLQIWLAEVSQFFRVALEREKIACNQKTKGEETKQDAGHKKENSFATTIATNAEYAPNRGVMNPPRDYQDLSPPKSRYPGEHRIKNREGERNFSGPTLEPDVYNPAIPHSRSYPQNLMRQQ